MKICVLTSVYPRWPEDIPGTFIHAIMKRLRKRGHEIHVVAPVDSFAHSIEELDGVRIHRFQYCFPKSAGRLTYRGGMADNVESHSKHWHLARVQIPGYLFSGMSKLWELCHREQFDVINSHWAIPQGLMVSLLRLGPHIITTPGESLDFADIYHLNWLVRKTLVGADLVIPISSHVDSNVRRFTQNTRIIPFGVEVEHFSKTHVRNSSDHNILTCAYLIPRKGIHVLLQSMKIIHEKLPQARLTIVGEGPLKPTLVNMANELGIAPVVKFMPNVPRSRLPEVMAKSTVFVLPSLSEGLGLVLVEAMCLGKPVVGTKAGGIVDVIDNEVNGLLVPPRNPTALAEAITRILQNKELGKTMGSAGKRMAEAKFSNDRIAVTYEQTFESLCKR